MVDTCMCQVPTYVLHNKEIYVILNLYRPFSEMHNADEAFDIMSYLIATLSMIFHDSHLSDVFLSHCLFWFTWVGMGMGRGGGGGWWGGGGGARRLGKDKGGER